MKSTSTPHHLRSRLHSVQLEQVQESRFRPLDFREGEHTSPGYHLKIDAEHQVPLLIVDGKILSRERRNSNLDYTHLPTQAELLPPDPWQKPQAISLMSSVPQDRVVPFLVRHLFPRAGL